MLQSSVIHHLHSKKHPHEKEDRTTTATHSNGSNDGFFIKHSYLSKIDMIEDALRALSLLLPGRFEDADLCSQCILTVLNLVSCFHTKSLINKSTKHLQFENDAFNSRFQHQDRYSKKISWALSVISYTEVLFEMILRRKTQSSSTTYKRWEWITLIEGFKAILRIVLLYVSKKRMLLHPMHPIRNVDIDSLEMDVDEKYELLTLDPRNGTALSQVVAEEESTMKNTGSHIGSAVSEVLWIIRPFIYVAMTLLEQRRLRQRHNMYRHPKPFWSNEAKEERTKNNDEEEVTIEKEEEAVSWKPWIVSLCIDLLARMTRQANTVLEKEESRRRDYLLLYYLYRGPMYMTLTRNLLERFCNATEHRPLLSVIAAAIKDYKPFWEDTYFYTAGS